MGDVVTVRVASIADAPHIASVHVRSWQAAYRGQVPDDYLDSLSIEERETIWSGILRGSDLPSSGVFVSEADERSVVGFAAISPSRDDDAETSTGEIGSIYLLPAFWGAGHGRALIERATASLREAGFAAATLWVLDTNLRARRFYERAGWRPDGAQKVEDRGSFSLSQVRYRRSVETIPNLQRATPPRR